MSSEAQAEGREINMDELNETLAQIKESMSATREVVRSFNERCALSPVFARGVLTRNIE